MMIIKDMKGIEILDSRGNPTIEIDITIKSKKTVTARGIAPSGASRGEYEAWELRDGGRRYLGKGVLKAVNNVKLILKHTKNKKFTQKTFDEKLCNIAGPNKKKIGGNTTTAASLAFLNASAKLKGKWVYEYLGGKVLPVPFMNIINGGRHAGNRLAIQEFLIVPFGAKTFKQAVQWNSEIYHTLGKYLVDIYGPTAKNVGDEGGYAPPMENTEQALSAIYWAIEELGYNGKVGMAIDAAASEFYDKMYNIDGASMTPPELLEYYEQLIAEYPIVSIEDPFEQNDYRMFSELRKTFSNTNVQIIADDLTVTNLSRVKRAIDEGSMDTLLLKVNQIGTVYEAYEAFKYCLSHGVRTMISHRSGETEDTTIADLAVGLETGQIKSGAPARGERTAKYNQLLRIEERLGKKAKYAGKDFRKYGRKIRMFER
ncbi:phosphopyruvate hydratase [Candidatus Micrarchaeota archaeon]|nr:phosphopyruvate hydratase [Candidatus Micrarchaeota archaeon]